MMPVIFPLIVIFLERFGRRSSASCYARAEICIGVFFAARSQSGDLRRRRASEAVLESQPSCG